MNLMSTLFSDYLSLSAVVLVIGMYVINVYCALHEQQDGEGSHTISNRVGSHSCGH